MEITIGQTVKPVGPWCNTCIHFNQFTQRLLLFTVLQYRLRELTVSKHSSKGTTTQILQIIDRWLRVQKDGASMARAMDIQFRRGLQYFRVHL